MNPMWGKENHPHKPDPYDYVGRENGELDFQAALILWMEDRFTTIEDKLTLLNEWIPSPILNNEWPETDPEQS